MNAVDSFSAQVGNYLNPPSWPVATPVAVQSTFGATNSTGNSAATYWYPLAQGNPQSLTVAQVVGQAYGLDPTRDSSQIQQMASYVAQQNGLFLANFPIPSNVTGLKLPWAPKNQGTSANSSVKPKSHFNLGNLFTGIAAAAAGIGQIVMRHDGQLGSQLGGQLSGPFGGQTYGGQTYGGLSNGAPSYSGSNSKVGMIAADIADGAPALADLAAAIAGDPIPQSNPYAGQNSGAWPQQVTSYPQQPSSPYFPQEVGTPAYPQQPTYPSQPSYGAQPSYPTYPTQPSYPTYPTQPSYPTYPAQSSWQPPTTSPWQQQGGWSSQGASYSAQGGNGLGTIVSSVTSLAQTFGQLFGRHR